MDQILAEEPPSYQNEEIRLTLGDLKGRWFRASDAFCKAITCLYAYAEPKSFASNSLVKLDNSWLKVASSRNYHHFFPRSFLRKQGIDDQLANSVLNITLVDDYLNKRKVRAKPPSVYMREFQATNPELEATMKTHFIDDMDASGVWTDDYEAFLTQRGNRILAELSRRLGTALSSDAERTGPIEEATLHPEAP